MLSGPNTGLTTAVELKADVTSPEIHTVVEISHLGFVDGSLLVELAACYTCLFLVIIALLVCQLQAHPEPRVHNKAVASADKLASVGLRSLLASRFSGTDKTAPDTRGPTRRKSRTTAWTSCKVWSCSSSASSRLSAPSPPKPTSSRSSATSERYPSPGHPALLVAIFSSQRPSPSPQRWLWVSMGSSVLRCASCLS